MKSMDHGYIIKMKCKECASGCRIKYRMEAPVAVGEISESFNKCPVFSGAIFKVLSCESFDERV